MADQTNIILWDGLLPEWVYDSSSNMYKDKPAYTTAEIKYDNTTTLKQKLDAMQAAIDTIAKNINIEAGYGLAIENKTVNGTLVKTIGLDISVD